MLGPEIAVFVAASEASGRGDNPSTIVGILVVAGIAGLVVALAAQGLWTVTQRRGRS